MGLGRSAVLLAGLHLPVGCLMRTPNGRYPEYHSSVDDLSLITPAALAESLAAYTDVINVLERDGRYRNLNPDGEPQLGKRGLYTAMAEADDAREHQLAMLWVLNYSDGGHSLLDIAELSGMPFTQARRAADVLGEHGLLAPADAGGGT